MTRVEGEIPRRRVCTSNPFISAIRISMIARSGQCVAACSKNMPGSVNALTCQPTESRSRLVALRTEGSSSKRKTARVSLLSATMLNFLITLKIVSGYLDGFDGYGRTKTLSGRNIRHATMFACQTTEKQSDLSPGSDRRGNFSFLQYDH